MILLDLNQIMYSNIAMSIKKNDMIEENLLRHMVLNTIRSNLMKFKSKFSRLVICVDSKNNWRKEVFPYYKARRAIDRDKSLLNWPKIFGIMEKLTQEIKENFNYPVIAVDGAEADDIIGELVRFSTGFNILILSADKDFGQLHDKINMQYDPVRKREIKVSNPQDALKEHIIRGDFGDGIPNILSADDSIISGRRQTPITKKQVEIWFATKLEDFSYEVLRNYKRNEMLIDLNFTPEKIKQQIKTVYDLEIQKEKNDLLPYFMKHNLRNLMENLQDFV